MKHLACALALAACASPALASNAGVAPPSEASVASVSPDADAAASAPPTAPAPASTQAPAPATTLGVPVAPPSTFRWRVMLGSYGGITGGGSHIDVYDGGAIIDGSPLAPGGHGAVATAAELAEIEQLLVAMKARGELWAAPAQPPSAGHVPARRPVQAALEGPDWPNLRAARLRELVGSMWERARRAAAGKPAVGPNGNAGVRR